MIGLGHELLMDDGIGVRLVRELARERLPDGISVHEIGTAVFAAASLVEPGVRLLIVDAMRGGGVPGSIYIEDYGPGGLAGAGRGEGRQSLHDIGILDLPGLLRPGGETAAGWRIFGVEPLEIRFGYGLTPLLAAALPVLAAALKQEALRMLNNSRCLTP